MGVYATFDDVHYGGPPTFDPRDEECTACRNTGVVAFPVNVGADVVEWDPCPYGCVELEPDELEHLLWPERKDWWPSSFQLFVGRFGREHVNVHPRARKLVGAWTMRSLTPQGRVTTDEPVTGWLNDDKATVPAYLPGRPVEFDEDRWLTVEYEHMGSKLQLVFLPTEAGKFRFAHLWDEGTTTQELLT